MAVKSIHPDVSIPENLSWPEFVFRDFDEYGNRIAIICSSTKRKYTFTQVKDLSRKVASAFNKRGIKKGDVIAIFAPNVAEFAIFFLGALQMGAVVTGVNPLFTSVELTNQLKETNAKCIITVHQLAHRAKEAARELDIDHLLFVIGDGDGPDSVSVLFEDDGSAFPLIEFHPKDDLAILPFSSGTGGLPRGVMLTHYNLVALGCIVSANGFLAVNDKSPARKSTILALVPFHRTFGMAAVLSLALHQGSTLISMPRFDQNNLFHLLQDYKVTHLATEASIVHLLSNNPAVDNFDLSSLMEVMSSASPLSEETSRNVKRRLRQLRKISQCYGMTENTGMSHVTPSADAKHGSVGVLLPNLECKVCDVSTGEALGAEGRGEICVRGPTVMKGYLDNQDASDQMIDSEGWLHTGDVGYYDEDERFFIVDRLKDLIKFRGHQVSPSELESLLRAHPAIKDAAVIGVPDPEVGELPMAYVVSTNEEDLTEIEIMQYVDENAAPHKKLRGGVVFIPSIPKSANGEVLRAELKEKLIQGTYKPVQMRRVSLFVNGDKRVSLKRNSLGMRTMARNNDTILEEKPREVMRSKSCIIL
ncbi:hypothetical protein ACROYT_G039465 [Oculina patagonica]